MGGVTTRLSEYRELEDISEWIISSLIVLNNNNNNKTTFQEPIVKAFSCRNKKKLLPESFDEPIRLVPISRRHTTSAISMVLSSRFCISRRKKEKNNNHVKLTRGRDLHVYRIRHSL